MIVKARGALIDTAKLQRLAFDGIDTVKTDHERELRVALQDALVLAELRGDALREALDKWEEWEHEVRRKWMATARERIVELRKLVQP